MGIQFERLNYSTMAQVKSKNLFNFAPKGCYDEDLMASLMKSAKRKIEKFGFATVELEKGNDQDNIKLMREFMDFEFDCLAENPHFDKMLSQCENSSFTLPENDIKVYVHIPQCLKNSASRAAIIYAHGGGAISGTAEKYQPVTATLAVETQCVVFCVEYRLAPETKCPDNIKDFYNALKFVRKNHQRWNVNPEKIIISGESGGGYITFGTMVMLAQNDESHLVSAAFPIIPMISDYGWSDTDAMTVEERACVKLGIKLMWKYIAKDLDVQWSDPLLFPSKASDELIKKMPPTVIISAEFDIFLTETERMARRMRQNGRLLELISIPGITHGNYMDPSLNCYKTFHDSYKLAVDEYVKKERRRSIFYSSYSNEKNV